MHSDSGRWLRLVFFPLTATAGLATAAFGEVTSHGIVLPGAIPYAFVLFVLVLLGIGLFHHHTLYVALVGAAVITLYTAWLAPDHHPSPATPGLWPHFVHELDHTLLNLGALILGFTLLADLFERSHVPEHLVRVLPRSPFRAAIVLLAIVWVLSSFLDNIAAAMIGGVMAMRTFRAEVGVAFLAALIAASNAGGAWSVLGDTTTTMMWIAGISPWAVLHCIVASAVAFACFAIPGARKQAQLTPDPVAESGGCPSIDWLRLLNVLLVLLGALTTNVLLDRPFVGVWAMLFVGSLWRAPTWSHLGPAMKGTAFLLSLVWCASLMPVRALPEASWVTALGLGFLSAVFDNIPLTKLALAQGGYDWGVLSFAVGFGGSMLWFGSSAGVALAAVFPALRNTGRYLYEAWPVAVAYVVGFAALLAAMGWHPTPILRH